MDLKEQKVFPKIIMHMKARFQRSENFPLSLDEILDEIQVYDLSSKNKTNLDTQILPKNPKLEDLYEDGVHKYTFKPSYIIRNRKDLIGLIKDNQLRGLGGVLKDDVQDSMTTEDFEKVFKKLGEEIVEIVGKGKKKVLFYNDKASPENLPVDKELVELWRNVTVDGMDEKKIEDYLENQHIVSMKDASVNKLIMPNKRKSARGRQSKKLNDHMGNILQEYNPDLVKK